LHGISKSITLDHDIKLSLNSFTFERLAFSSLSIVAVPLILKQMNW